MLLQYMVYNDLKAYQFHKANYTTVIINMDQTYEIKVQKYITAAFESRLIQDVS